jgi:hypothetical protein
VRVCVCVYLCVCACRHTHQASISLLTHRLFMILLTLSSHRTSSYMCQAIFTLAVLITLVPAHLLELRYFSPAIVIAMISTPHTQAPCIRELFTPDRNNEINEKRTETGHKSSKLFNHPSLLLSICACFVIDVLVVFVFLYRPFNWVDNSLARFMF